MHTTRLRSVSIAAVLATLAIVQAATAADGDFCGRPRGEPAALEAEISKAPGFKEIHRGPEYVAYQEEATEAVFTFSLPAQGPAHPAAICRKPVKDGDSITLQMVIVCNGEIAACQSLESDFKLLNAQMEAAIRNEAGQTADKK